MSHGDETTIRLANGFAFYRSEERIREYCDTEVYRDVAYRGGYDDHHSVTDVVTKDDLEAANNLYANLTTLGRRRILGKTTIPAQLALVKDVELAEIPPQEWKGVKATLESLLAEFLTISEINLAQTTKVLHLKRPHLFPILDSYVVKFLTGNETEKRFTLDELIKIALDSFEIVRNDIARNSSAFAALQKRLADLPTPLTTVRLHSILCWTQEKWVNRGITSAPRGIAIKSLDQGPAWKTEVQPAAPVAESLGKNPAKPQHEGEITTVRVFRQTIARAEGVIVITGSFPPRAHTPFCDLLTDDRFNENVIMRETPSARYYWRSSLVDARKEFGAVACKKCRPTDATRPTTEW